MTKNCNHGCNLRSSMEQNQPSSESQVPHFLSRSESSPSIMDIRGWEDGWLRASGTSVRVRAWIRTHCKAVAACVPVIQVLLFGRWEGQTGASPETDTHQEYALLTGSRSSTAWNTGDQPLIPSLWRRISDTGLSPQHLRGWGKHISVSSRPPWDI